MNEQEHAGEFALSVTARLDGSVEAAYIKISDAPVASTKELRESVLLADFDEDEQLVGVEILAPVKLAEVLDLAERLEHSQRQGFRAFVTASAPPALVAS